MNQLPAEILLHIFRYSIYPSSNNNQFYINNEKEHYQIMKNILSLQTICGTTFRSQEISNHFQAFWWNTLKIISGCLYESDELMEFKTELIGNNTLRRCALMLFNSYVGRKLIEKEPHKTHHQQEGYHEVSILVRGDGNSGRKALIYQLVDGSFPQYYPRIEDSFRKAINVYGVSVVLNILNMVGGEEYIAIRQMAFKGTECFVIMSDINNLDSVRNVENHLKDLKEGNVDLQTIPVIFSLNKIDKIACYEVEAMMILHDVIKKYQIRYGTIVKTSALNNINVETLFRECVKLHFIPKRSIAEMKKYIKEHNEEHKHKKCLLM